MGALSTVRQARLHGLRLAIPPELAREAGIEENTEVVIRAEKGRIIIEPEKKVPDPIELALYGKRIGYIDADELEEESLCEQEKLQDTP